MAYYNTLPQSEKLDVLLGFFDKNELAIQPITKEDLRAIFLNNGIKLTPYEITKLVGKLVMDKHVERTINSFEYYRISASGSHFFRVSNGYSNNALSLYDSYFTPKEPSYKGEISNSLVDAYILGQEARRRLRESGQIEDQTFRLPSERPIARPKNNIGIPIKNKEAKVKNRLINILFEFIDIKTEDNIWRWLFITIFGGLVLIVLGYFLTEWLKTL